MLILTVYLMFAMLAVMWFDVTRYIIPNWLVGSLLLLYPLALWMVPHAVDWKMALAAMGIVFVAGYGVFIMRWMGGGDIKLMTACALWAGWEHLLDFVFLFACLGGAMSVALIVIRKFEPYYSRGRKAPRILRGGEPVPYGLAIASAFIILLWTGDITALAVK